VRDCGFETTAIMPFGARTIPSSRSVLTCKPNLPGGRFGAPLPAWRPSSDSNGSRRACFTSLSAAAGAVPGVLGFSTVLTARFAGGFFAPAFAAGLVACAVGLLADGIPGLAAVCGAGLVAARAAGFAAACGVGLVGAGAAGLAAVCGAGFVAPGAAGLPAPACAGFALLGAVGFACARNPGAAATIRIPSPRVIAERIVRSFQFTITGPPQLQAWFRLQEPHPCRRVW
jgi:hypothetical protein